MTTDTQSDSQPDPQPQVPGWIRRHLEEYATDPERARLFDASAVGGREDTPTLLLTTRGRRTGRILTMPLIYGESGGAYVVIASKGGAPAHPGWFHNLSAEPDVDIQVGAEKLAVTARVAEGEERARLWGQMTEIYPPYLEYQEKTDRVIPVVVLEPR